MIHSKAAKIVQKISRLRGQSRRFQLRYYLHSWI